MNEQRRELEEDDWKKTGEPSRILDGRDLRDQRARGSGDQRLRANGAGRQAPEDGNTEVQVCLRAAGSP